MTSTTERDLFTLPAVGFGTYPLKGEVGVEAIVSALKTGYRYLDSAVNYENEEEVGDAIRKSHIPRDEVMVATKIPGRFHAKDLAAQSLRDSASRMKLDHVDVALIHWPNPSVDLYVEAWQALIEAQQAGLVKEIGVSNFTAQHLRRIIDETGVTPLVNQIELHPYFPQVEMVQVHEELGIRTQAWSPLGKASAPYSEDPVVEAAKAHDATPAQVILRWHVQRNVMPLPKSATPSRQKENLDVLGLDLTDAEVAAITALGKPDGRLFGGDPDTHEEQ